MTKKTPTRSYPADCSMADPAAIYYTPQRVLDYVAANSLLPCPVCGGEARIWTDIDTPATYCRKNCAGGRRFYRKSAAASARAWNTYVKATL